MNRFKIAQKELNGVLFFFCLCKGLLLLTNLFLGDFLYTILHGLFGDTASRLYVQFASYGTLPGLLLEIVIFTICLFLPICLYFFFSGKKYTQIVPMQKPELLQICFGVGTTVVLGNLAATLGDTLLSIFFSILGMEDKYYAMLQSDIDYPENFWLVPLFAIMLAVMPAVFEEISMRGIALNVTKKFGIAFSLLFNGFFFTFLHSSWTQLPYAFVIGIVLAYFTMRFNTIWIAVISHFAFNFSSVIQCLILQNSGQHADFWNVLFSSVFTTTMIGFMVAGLIVYGVKSPNVPKSEFTSGQKFKALVTSPFFYVFISLEAIQLLFLLLIY